MRYTRIVATMGPVSNGEKSIEELAKLGVNVFRLNFSHGDHVFHGGTIRNVRKAAKKLDRPLAIMLDTKGPEIRTGDVTDPIVIRRGDLVAFAPQGTKVDGKETVIRINYPHFAKDCRQAEKIVIDNGSIDMSVVRIKGNVVIARALDEGIIKSRRHVNLPGAHISLPSFTEKDWADIEYGVREGVDFYAVSFIRSGKDVKELKAYLRKHGSPAHIIAKIETPQAVSNIDDIIQESDGVMVARGDLGSEVPFEEVPRIQDDIVRKCRLAAKPVIVATHMLESMIKNPTPTRAEVTDVAYAARSQADSTMLSGETAAGDHPMKAVEAMCRVLEVSEKIDADFSLIAGEGTDLERVKREQALSASVLATTLNADAMIVISRHGFTARAVSNCRPLVPIHAFADSESCRRRMNLLWGVIPHCIPFSESTETTATRAISMLIRKKTLRKGQQIVLVSDIGKSGSRVMSIQIRTL